MLCMSINTQIQEVIKSSSYSDLNLSELCLTKVLFLNNKIQP